MSSKHVAGKKTAKRKGKKVKKAKKKAATPEMAPTARDARMQLVADLEERVIRVCLPIFAGTAPALVRRSPMTLFGPCMTTSAGWAE